MPGTKATLRAPKRNSTRTAPETVGRAEVLTLAEAAAYLRVSAEDVLRMIDLHGLPGRQLGGSWRFFKPALQQWLGTSPRKKGLLSQIGTLKDDPYRHELLRDIYKRRGRPETEQG